MQTLRLINAYLAVPAMMLSGFRFSKDYRWGVSRFHRFVYRMVDTVAANHIAGLPRLGG